MVYNLDKSEFQLFNLFHRSFLDGVFFQIFFLNVHLDPWEDVHPFWGLHNISKGLVKKTPSSFPYTKKKQLFPNHPKKKSSSPRHFPPFPLRRPAAMRVFWESGAPGFLLLDSNVWLFVWGWWVGGLEDHFKRTWRDVGFDVWNFCWYLFFVGGCYRIPMCARVYQLPVFPYNRGGSPTQ